MPRSNVQLESTSSCRTTEDFGVTPIDTQAARTPGAVSRGGAARAYGREQRQQKVCIFSDRWTAGGVEAYTTGLVETLDRSKRSIDLLTAQKESDVFDDRLSALGLRVTEMLTAHSSAPVLRMLRSFLVFGKVIGRGQYDVVYLNVCNSVALAYAWIARRKGVARVVAHAHMDRTGDGRCGALKRIAHSIFKLLLSGSATNLASCSKRAETHMFSKTARARIDVETVRNGIDTGRFRFNPDARRSRRRELGLDGKVVYGWVGRLSSDKDLPFLLDVYQQLATSRTALLIVGDGDEREKLEDMSRRLGVDPSVIFCGVESNVPEMLHAMDIFLLPSRIESFGIAVLEAQASGLPCVVSDAVPRDVEATDLLTFLPTNDSHAWARAIEGLKPSLSRELYADVVEGSGFGCRSAYAAVEELIGS